MIALLEIAGLLALALDVFTIARAVTRGGGVESTLAWILAILAFPGAGALAYLLLASPSIRRVSRRKRLARAALRAAIAERLGGHCEAAAAGQSATGCSLLHLATALTGLPPSAGNAVEILAEGPPAFDRLEQALATARRSIWAEYYIVQDDATGGRFLDLLTARAAAGVEVRFLYDAVGSGGLPFERLAALRRAGGRTEAFLPVNPLRRRWSLHLRNHRKLLVVDGTLGFAGGMNVGDEYSGRVARRARRFRDTHLALAGPAVGDLAQVFAEDWSFASGEPLLAAPPPAPVPGGGAVVATVPSGPDQEWNASALVYFSAIAGARERCWLTSPYFVPDPPVLRALSTAAMRGVDVRLLVPERCDVAVVGLAARTYYGGLLRAGVRVFEYRRGMLHAKTLVVDGEWGIVGSANVDARSFRLNFELGALVLDPAFARELGARFEADLGHSRELHAASLAARPRWVQARDGLARLLSPLL